MIDCIGTMMICLIRRGGKIAINAFPYNIESQYVFKNTLTTIATTIFDANILLKLIGFL